MSDKQGLPFGSPAMSRGIKNDDTSIPTLKDIEGWESQCVQIDADIKALLQRKGGLQSLITGARRLLPSQKVAKPSPANQRIKKVRKATKKRVVRPPKVPKPSKTAKIYKSHGDNATWTATIQEILEKAGRGLTYEELKAEVLKTHLGEKLQRTDKSFYGAIGKLADGKHLVRHKGRLFAAAAHVQFMKDVAAGKVADTPAPLAGHKSPMTAAVKEFLKTREFGAISSEIVHELKKNPEFVPTLEKNKTHIYNILSRLISREELFKKGERYLLARNTNLEAA
jgi:hypothetical protein